MSDFGIMLSGVKKNGGAISSDELSLMSDRLETIIKDNDFAGLMEPFQHELYEAGEGEAVVQLSEHYFGDEDPEESKEFVEENELDDAKDIATLMNAQFSEMTFTASLEEW